MRLYIIRHGDPNYEQDCLTPAGKIEAEALAEFMQYVGPDSLYSSPLGRAKETANYTAKAVHQEVTILPWTRELSGMHLKSDSSLMPWDIAGQTVRVDEYLRSPEAWENITDFDNLPRIREAYQTVVQGSDAFLRAFGYERDGHIYHIQRPNTLKIAVFCHAGFASTWLAHLLAIPLPLMWAGFLLHTTSVTTILMDERQPGTAVPRCLGLGELPHLYWRKIQPSLNGVIANYE